jgi:hypothetical protein
VNDLVKSDGLQKYEPWFQLAFKDMGVTRPYLYDVRIQRSKRPKGEEKEY